MAKRPDPLAVRGEAFCESPADFYRPATRMAMVRLCAEAFDSRRLTPVEFLHSDFHQRLIYESGELLNAFQKAAFVQAKTSEKTPQERQRELVFMFDKVVAGTRKRAMLYQAPRFKPSEFPKVLAEIRQRFKDADRSFVLFRTLAVFLDGSGSWLTKIHKLASLYDPDHDDEVVHHLDQVLGDIMVNGVAVAELFELVEGLEQIIPRLIELHDGVLGGATDGRGPTVKGDVVDRYSSLEFVNQMIGTGRFPATKGAVIEVIRRVIESSRRYRAEERASELSALMETFALFDGASQELRESAVMDAFKTRVGWAVSENNLAKFRETEPRPGPRLEKLIFFSRFIDNDFKAGVIEDEIEITFRDETLFGDLVREGDTLIDKLNTFARLHRRIQDAAMDAFRKLTIMKRVADMQERFIKENEFFQSLATMETDVVKRAMLMIDLCREDSLVHERSRSFAQRVIKETVGGSLFRKLYLRDAKNKREEAELMGDLATRLTEAGLME